MKNQNFISVDKQTVLSSYGEMFIVGESVNHQDEDVDTAIIISFEPSIERNEIKVHTNKGYAHLDFLEKLKETV